ncbi:MAG: Flp pilus assembly protein CpaB [Stellaceae bacterium]
MSFRRILLLFLALAVSGATVVIGRAALAPHRVVAAAPQAPVTHVLVAQGTLTSGQFVRPENLRWQAWPTKDVPASYVVEGKGRLEDMVGAVVRTGLSDGEPVTDGRVVRPGDRGFLAAVLMPGDRAISVPVTVSSGIAGFVFPGDRVDLLLTMAVAGDSKDRTQRHAAETLLSNIRVLAMDQRTDDQTKKAEVAKTATLEVTPKEAETVAVATELGNLSLSLRSLAKGDAADQLPPYSHTWDSDATHLMNPPGTGVPTAAAPEATKVTVVRGSDAKEIAFARSGR